MVRTYRAINVFQLYLLLVFGTNLSAKDYEVRILPLLETYCYDCHGDGISKGDVDLGAFEDAKTRLSKVAEWKRVWAVLEDQQMPPQNKKQPSSAERVRIRDWIEKAVFRHDPANPDPGRVTIRRLNRAEYGNTIRDLFGLPEDFRPEEKFPVDDSGYGFDNIGDVLTVPPILMEKYLAAADETLEKALVLGPPPKRKQTFSGESFVGSGQNRDGARLLTSSGQTYLEAEVSKSGEYYMRIRAHGDQAGGEKVRAGFFIDGKKVGEVTIPETRNSPGSHQIKLKIGKGSRRLGVDFSNDYYNPRDPNPSNRDRNLYVHNLELEGPIGEPLPSLPESHTDIFFTDPKSADGDEEAAWEILNLFASRAFRRPAQKEEVTRLVQLYNLGKKDNLGFEKSVALAMKAVLISPSFLFRGEVQPSPDNPTAIHPVDEYALASRLSYFLWSSMPDRELLSLAWKGELRKNFEVQVRRMLADPRADALARNFAGQWLELRSLEKVMPDKKRFPKFNPQLVDDMRQETERFFLHIQKGNRSVLEFLEADYSFLNERLARHYDISDVRGGEFRQVSLKGGHRGGVLTHASVLTLTSNPTRTSPVKRGKWVLENLLGLPPPPPDPDAPPLPEDSKALEAASLRELLIKHREASACAACHANMDPIGLALENFDPVGGWREKDGKHVIDPSGELANGRFINGPMQLRALLARDYRKEYLICLTEMMLTYALGRGLEYYDRSTVEAIVSALEKDDYRFETLVLGIAKSDPFQLRRGDGDRASASPR